MKRVEECFTTLQSSHLLYHSKANNHQADVGFLMNKGWKVMGDFNGQIGKEQTIWKPQRAHLRSN